ncbi:MAG: lipopolysaccharide heptosyltransferase family protein [Chloroflexi bacterium]|nr:lipopolysaccharide heptosyltransferase family protein [Chloroflexota bacterium]
MTGTTPTHCRTRVITLLARALSSGIPTRSAPDPASIRRLIIIKPASLGDVILSSPAIATLRRAFPKAHLTLATGQWSLPAARGIPGVDAIQDLGTFGTPGRFGIRDLPGAVARFRAGRHDLAIVLDRSTLVAVAPLLAGIPHRAGIDSAGRGFAHTIRIPWVIRIHEADLYQSVAHAATSRSAVATDPGEARLEFRPTTDAKAIADRLWSVSGLTDRADATHAAPIVVVHPGGASNPGMTLAAKRWPADRFATVIRALIARGIRVVLVGHTSDARIVADVRHALEPSGASPPALPGTPIFDLSGDADLATLAALIGRADAYLGNDSVPLHLAVAMGTPAVAVYGPTDPRVYGPWAPVGGTYAGKGIGIVDPGACSQVRAFRPGPVDACPGCRCIDRIDATTVTNAVLHLLGSE